MARSSSTTKSETTATETETVRGGGKTEDGYTLGEEKPAVADPEPKPRPYHEAITEEQRELLGDNAPKPGESAQDAAAS